MTSEPAAISTIGVLTCERPDVLERSLSAFAGQRTATRIVVADDSRTAEGRAATRHVVRRAAGRGLCVQYLGVEEKCALVDELCRRSGVAKSTIAFALLDPEGVGETIGANRNALLLALAGERFLSFDDDVLPVVARPDAEHPELASITPGEDPTDFEFFENRAAVLARVRLCHDDLVALHARWLGAHVASGNAGARVVVTSTGVYGDSGMSSPVGLLCSASPATRARLLRSERAFRVATTCREVRRMARRPTLAPLVPLMAGAIGIDASGLLPPFVPVLRNEDGVWGAVSSRVRTDALGLHLPRAVFHDTPPNREYEPSLVRAAGISRQSCVLLSVAATHGFREPTASARLRSLGARLCELGTLPSSTHAGVLRELLGRWASGRVQRMLRVLAGLPDPPSFWWSSVQAYRSELERAAADGSLYVPADLRAGDDPVRALERSRSLAARYGELLQAWPALFSASRKQAPQLRP